MKTQDPMSTQEPGHSLGYPGFMTLSIGRTQDPRRYEDSPKPKIQDPIWTKGPTERTNDPMRTKEKFLCQFVDFNMFLKP